MAGFILALLLLGIALLAMALQKTYSALTPKELKRRAREKDPLAVVLYKAVAYGAALAVMLWTVTVLTAAASFVLLSQVAPPFLAFVTVAVALAYGFVWMPAHRATKAGMQVAVWLTPVIARLLAWLHPAFDWLVKFVQKHRPVTVHTGLYDRDDLLQLIEQQKHQPDSRISDETLELLAHALQFGDKVVGDCMVPRRAVQIVPADVTVSPALINDLHASGFSRFPVLRSGVIGNGYGRHKGNSAGSSALATSSTNRSINKATGSGVNGKADEINNKKSDGNNSSDNGTDPIEFAGTLYLRDLITLKHTGKVADVMQPNVYYVHEDHPLEQVLDAFLKTHHHLFVVVNSFEEFVGIITIEDILEQILGCKIVDEFDQYDDMRAVAAHQAKTDHSQRRQDGEEVVKGERASEGAPDVGIGDGIPVDEGRAKKGVGASAASGRPAGKHNPYPQGTLKHVIHAAGFRGEALEVAYAVAIAESSGKPDAHNDDESTGDDSYGLFQINMLGEMGPERRKQYSLGSNKELFDPLTNAKVAFELSQGGRDWQPWTMYTNGKYKKFYDKKANRRL